MSRATTAQATTQPERPMGGVEHVARARTRSRRRRRGAPPSRPTEADVLEALTRAVRRRSRRVGVGHVATVAQASPSRPGPDGIIARWTPNSARAARLGAPARRGRDGRRPPAPPPRLAHVRVPRRRHPRRAGRVGRRPGHVDDAHPHRSSASLIALALDPADRRHRAPPRLPPRRRRGHRRRRRVRARRAARARARTRRRSNRPEQFNDQLPETLDAARAAAARRRTARRGRRAGQGWRTGSTGCRNGSTPTTWRRRPGPSSAAWPAWRSSPCSPSPCSSTAST